jgi:hypothetical protein
MVRARRIEEWAHTSWIVAAVHNFSYPTRKSLKPSDFNPMESAKEQASDVVKVDMATFLAALPLQ